MNNKQIRLLLLDKETQLYQNNCMTCPKRNEDSNKRNKGCKSCTIFSQLRDIGEKLLKSDNLTFDDVKRYVKEEQKMTLTVERYQELKQKGYTDRKIMTEFGMNNASFYKWKNENGLIGDSKYSNQKDKVTAPESDFKPVPPASDEDKLKIAFKENERLRAEIESLEEKVQSYEEQIEKFKNKLSIHVQRISELNSLNEAIKERNEELLVEINKLKESSINTKRIQRTRQLNVLLMQELIELGGQQ